MFGFNQLEERRGSFGLDCGRNCDGEGLTVQRVSTSAEILMLNLKYLQAGKPGRAPGPEPDSRVVAATPWFQ